MYDHVLDVDVADLQQAVLECFSCCLLASPYITCSIHTGMSLRRNRTPTVRAQAWKRERDGGQAVLSKRNSNGCSSTDTSVLVPSTPVEAVTKWIPTNRRCRKRPRRADDGHGPSLDICADLGAFTAIAARPMSPLRDTSSTMISLIKLLMNCHIVMCLLRCCPRVLPL